ncbi:MAG: 50S ribosomal protein L4 [Candidatus Omnitrophota bacterium]
MKRNKERKIKEFNTRLDVFGLDGKAVGKIQLDEKVFDGHVNQTLLYEAKKMYEANSRRGTASSKTRSEVSGGGAKPWKQKGTGRARVGSSRNPIWRHGGVAFGPRPRDFSYSMPKKALKKALISGLNARLSEKMVKAVVEIKLDKPKTSAFKAILDNLKVEGKVLVVVESISRDVKRSSGNLKRVSLKEGKNINVRDVLLNGCILAEKTALEKLGEKLK